MHRYTYYFFNLGQGWTETLYRNNPFGPGDEILHQNYITRRLEALATTAYLTNVRASNVDTKRDIIITQLPLPGRGGAWGATAAPGSGETAGQATETEDTFTALLLRLSDGGSNFRSFPMLGIPDQIFQGNGIVPAEQAGVNLRLNNWMSAMNQASFGMKAQGVPSATGRISDFPAKTVDNQLVCLGLKGVIPAVGSHVILNGVKPFNNLNRTWRVSETAPAGAGSDGYIFLAGSSKLNTYLPVEGGTYKVPTYGVVLLTQYTISRLTSRKTGVPFATVRGRRSR